MFFINVKKHASRYGFMLSSLNSFVLTGRALKEMCQFQYSYDLYRINL